MNRYDAIFYMENGDVFEIPVEYDNKETMIKWLQENIGNISFLASCDVNKFVNMKNVNYFEIKEKEEVTA